MSGICCFAHTAPQFEVHYNATTRIAEVIVTRGNSRFGAQLCDKDVLEFTHNFLTTSQELVQIIQSGIDAKHGISLQVNGVEDDVAICEVIMEHPLIRRSFLMKLPALNKIPKDVMDIKESEPLINRVCRLEHELSKLQSLTPGYIKISCLIRANQTASDTRAVIIYDIKEKMVPYKPESAISWEINKVDDKVFQIKFGWNPYCNEEFQYEVGTYVRKPLTYEEPNYHAEYIDVETIYKLQNISSP
mmetsp:Transcript_20301/g.34577  ORF Transcript_20301/g.34577 Transcript_20301/m.34577 type:complete len:246 (-) Transcript_20301:20-757(-)